MVTPYYTYTLSATKKYSHHQDQVTHTDCTVGLVAVAVRARTRLALTCKGVAVWRMFQSINVYSKWDLTITYRALRGFEQSKIGVTVYTSQKWGFP